MSKTILITGATDGIGLATASSLQAKGHRVLLHGRNPAKLAAAVEHLGGDVPSYRADFSRLEEVRALGQEVRDNESQLDVVINNAGILKTATPVTDEGLDVRFVVNTFAPYLLTQTLLPTLGRNGRVLNLSSAAQSTVDLDAMAGSRRLADMEAYAQSKLALTMWSRHQGLLLRESGPMMIAINPGSLLATKMVKEAFGSTRGGVEVGAEILVRAALDPEFSSAGGAYFDNDTGGFSDPHSDALDPSKTESVLAAIAEAVS